MKHSDHKKLNAMVCAGVLSVSCFIGCVYGPETTDELKESCAVDLEQLASNENAMPKPDSIHNS